jgi:2-phospho-L-lactate guanylyltransferase
MSEAVIVPLKRFDLAKYRLRRDDDLDVTGIAKVLAQGVIEASAPRHVIVVSEDLDVADFASSLGAEIWHSNASGLNQAVQGAYEGLQGRFERLIVAHGDLRLPAGLGLVDVDTGLTFYADHHGTGTNVVIISTGLDFRFAYGANSLARHVEEAERLDLTYRVITDSPWRFDVDERSDLEGP